jgi:hypothetical protein
VEGDIVLIAPGTYHEAVDVLTPNLTIRGLDRDGVVLDGQLELDNGIRVLGANGVAVENLTATNYTSNGVFFTSVQGYRASYISTYRTGDYGIYAFDSVGGLIEHAHTIGSKDAGVYIGQCYPCDAVITDVVSEHNGLGYSGTNSGGNLLIVDSVFRNNRAGIVPNSGSYELCYPERETTIVGNLVHSNNQADTPAIDVALLAQGQRHPGRRRHPQRHQQEPRVRPQPHRHRARAVPRGGRQRRLAHRGRVVHAGAPIRERAARGAGRGAVCGTRSRTRSP